MEQPQVYHSDYENFVNSQISQLISQERKRNSELSREEELNIAIDFCKKFLVDTAVDERRRSKVLAKLVELKLDLEQLKEFLASGDEIEPIAKVKGHEFVLQSASGRNPYCEVCLSTIWRLAQRWRRCKVCGFRAHEKCFGDVKRPCVNLKSTSTDFLFNLEICPEKTLPEQNYQCAECSAPIEFDDDPDKVPRLCDYDGNYYCRRCHWNDEMVIPARLVHSWDVEKRPVCRASKQLIAAATKKPVINLNKENPALFKFVHALNEMRKLRSQVMLMKCYFLCCKTARKLRILQYLHQYQHFVETDIYYTLDDLVQLANGRLLNDLETIVRIFKAHITEDCEICRGNAFFCELCSSDERIYPFSDDVSICKQCCAVFHRNCFGRVSKRCPRCARRKARRLALAAAANEESAKAASTDQ